MEGLSTIPWSRLDAWGLSFIVITVAFVLAGGWRLYAGEATASASILAEDGSRQYRMLIRTMGALSFIFIFGALFSEDGQALLYQLIKPVLKFFKADNGGSFRNENMSLMFSAGLIAQLLAAGILLLLAQVFPGFIHAQPDGNDRKKLNFNRADILRLWGLFATCLCLLAIASITWSFFAEIAAKQGQVLPNEIQDVVQLVAHWNGPSWVLSILFLSVTVGAPLIEEIGFRGIIYPALRDAIPRGWAIALTGILFGSLHGNLAALLPISVMGAWLCIIRDRFGLGTCILLHAMNNAWTIFWLVAAPEIATKL
jgi:hypothetical protein